MGNLPLGVLAFSFALSLLVCCCFVFSLFDAFGGRLSEDKCVWEGKWREDARRSIVDAGSSEGEARCLDVEGRRPKREGKERVSWLAGINVDLSYDIDR